MKKQTSATPKTADSTKIFKTRQALRTNFHKKVMLRLLEMIEILKQPESIANRTRLRSHCKSLLELGTQVNLLTWVELLKVASEVFANSEISYHTSAKLIIKEIKQAADLLIENRIEEIHASAELQSLTPQVNNFSSAASELIWEDEEADQLVDFWDSNIPELEKIELKENKFSEDLTLEDLFLEDEISNHSISDPSIEELLTFSEEDNLKDLELDLFDVSPNQGDSLDILDEDLTSLLELDSSKDEAYFELEEIEDLSDITNLDEFDKLFLANNTKPEPLVISPSNINAIPIKFYKQLTELDSLLEQPAADVTKKIQLEVNWNKLGSGLAVSTTTKTTKLTKTSSEQSAKIQKNGVSKDQSKEIPVFKQKEKLGLLDDEELDNLLEQDADQFIGNLSASSSMPSSQYRKPFSRLGAGLSEQTMRVSVKELNNLSNLIGELVIKRNRLEQDQHKLRNFLDNLLSQVHKLGEIGGKMQDLYERNLLEESLLANHYSEQPPTKSYLPSVPEENTNFLDIDHFSDFQILSRKMIELILRMRESTSDIQFIVDENEQVARSLQQVSRQLQEGMNKARMLPFSQTADRLPRAVREISRKLNKQVNLQPIIGRDVLIDKVILEHLYDPMTHLINNAITHGIELPEVRQQKGKSPEGQITVCAYVEGNQTSISVSDDGAGIDIEKLKAKVIEKKLIGETEIQTLSTQQLYDFLFRPGFTTKDSADGFAGRGVGLDVVRSSLTEIRGSVNIDSTLGKGTTFTIRLPLSLSICKAVCCLSNGARIAFPINGVNGKKEYSITEIETNAQGEQSIPWGEMLLPFQPLSNLLSYNCQMSGRLIYGGKQGNDDTVSIVVLSSGENFLAVQVDRVLEEQEIVIKPIKGPIPKPPGIAGATVLADGSIMAIGDVLELIDMAQGRISKESGNSLWQGEIPQSQAEIAEAQVEPMVMIIDDSITVRQMLSLSFAKEGYRVEQASDGQEAWEKLCSGLSCQVIFCDIDMPRMNGLEFLSRLQRDDKLASIPIAMLTSRGAQTHRDEAIKRGAKGYFTKPSPDKDLVDAARRMIEGEVVL